MVKNKKTTENIKKNEASIKKGTAMQCIRQFPAPLGKMVSKLVYIEDPRKHLQNTLRFHQLVLSYSAAIISSFYNHAYDYREFLKKNNNDPESLASVLKQKPLADKIGSSAIEPFLNVNWKTLNDWAERMNVSPQNKKSSQQKAAVWSEENLYDYLIVMGNELGFLRNFRVFGYEKSNKNLVSLTDRFPTFDKIVFEEGKKILGVPENFFEETLLIAYNIVENIFIPLTPFVILKENSLFFFKEFKGQKAVYQRIHNKSEASDEKLSNESEILPKSISFSQILKTFYKKDCKSCFPRPQWHDEFLLSLVTEETGLNQGVPNLLLQKGDKIIFTDARNRLNKKKLTVQEIEGRGMGRGVFTEVWKVTEELPGGKVFDYAMKILKPIFANTLIGDEFNQEIKNMQSLAEEFDKNKAEDYKKYFFIEVLEHGKVSFNKWWESQCFLMESADCSLRNRLHMFEDKKTGKK
ncbi:MAG: hypothetical protein GY950_06315, partial [bacterium]|nr:hypothetical protein [bacterium]